MSLSNLLNLCNYLITSNLYLVEYSIELFAVLGRTRFVSHIMWKSQLKMIRIDYFSSSFTLRGPDSVLEVISGLFRNEKFISADINIPLYFWWIKETAKLLLFLGKVFKILCLFLKIRKLSKSLKTKFCIVRLTY